jgi:hypothetical protein
VVDSLVEEDLAKAAPGVERAIIQSMDGEREDMDEETNLNVRWLGMHKEYEPLGVSIEDKPKPVELKELPGHLKYVFLGEGKTTPAIISNALTPENEGKLITVLIKNKEVIGWSIDDLKGISPAYCMQKIKMEKEYKHVVQPQRRLNPAMSEVKGITETFSGRYDLSTPYHPNYRNTKYQLHTILKLVDRWKYPIGSSKVSWRRQ